MFQPIPSSILVCLASHEGTHATRLWPKPFNEVEHLIGTPRSVGKSWMKRTEARLTWRYQSPPVGNGIEPVKIALDFGFPVQEVARCLYMVAKETLRSSRESENGKCVVMRTAMLSDIFVMALS